MPVYVAITGTNKSVSVRVPSGGEIVAPDNFAAALGDEEGGTLDADDYFYAVTALGSDGETLASTEDSQTISDSGVNEVQSVTVDATAGQYKITFSGQQTADIAYNATAQELEDALVALSNIGAGDVDVTGGPGDAGGTTPYVVTFQGALAETDVAQMTTQAGTTPLSGGASTAVVGTTTPGSPGDTVVLTWDEVVGATGYRVYKGLATGDYSEYFEVDAGTLTYTDDGTAGTEGDVPAEATAVVDAPAKVTAGSVVIVDVDDVKVRKALNEHRSIGQYAVVGTNNEYKDANGDIQTLPANA